MKEETPCSGCLHVDSREMRGQYQRDLPKDGLNDHGIEVLLRLEVVVDHGLVHAGPGSDIVGTRSVEPLFGKYLYGGRQDLPLGFPELLEFPGKVPVCGVPIVTHEKLSSPIGGCKGSSAFVRL